MVLSNVRIALTGEQVSVDVQHGKIAKVLPGPSYEKAGCIDFDDAIIFPGLINSHDHLDFNLFPALGDGIYPNYTEWGRSIHKNYKDQINGVLKVPLALREEWGVYKNLLCGVTTVVNHGKKVKTQTELLTIYEDCQSIHSVQFERKWKFALNHPLKKKQQVAIHSGEGTDISAFREIDQLNRWNLLKRPVVAIHGVAMTESQVGAFKALVWCPESNYFLLGKTAPVNRLKKHIPILFGTDSTLTGDWNIWNHIRRARKTRFMSDQELYHTLNTNPANTWKLNGGRITTGKDADLVIAKPQNGSAGKDAFYNISPQDILMVLHHGSISLFDETISPQLSNINPDEYSKVYIDGRCKFVKGNLPELIQKIKQYYPEANFPVN